MIGNHAGSCKMLWKYNLVNMAAAQKSLMIPDISGLPSMYFKVSPVDPTCPSISSSHALPHYVISSPLPIVHPAPSHGLCLRWTGFIWNSFIVSSTYVDPVMSVFVLIGTLLGTKTETPQTGLNNKRNL